MVTKTPNLELTEVQQSDTEAADSFNDSFYGLDMLVQLSVKSRTVTAAPAAPAQGDRYIVPTSGVASTDPWFPYPRRIAYWGPQGWIFKTPRPGWEAVIEDESSGSPQIIARAVYVGSTWLDVIQNGNPLTTKGDILTRDASDLARLPVGADYAVLQALTAAPGGKGVRWAPLVVSKGGILTFDGTKLVELAIGTDGYVLTANSATPNGFDWEAATGGGGGGGGATVAYGTSYLDTTPTSPTPYDDEFLTGAGLDTTGARRAGANAWTLELKTGNTPTIYSADFLKMDGTGGTDLVMLALQAVPGSGAWEFTMKAMGPAGNASYYGPMLCVVNHAGTSSNLEAMFSYGGSVYSQTNNYNSATKTFGFVSNNVQVTGFNGAAPYYLRLSYPGSGTTYTMKYAQFAGAFAFKQTMTGFDPFSTLTTRSLASVTHICIGTADSAVLNYVDWFRRTA